MIPRSCRQHQKIRADPFAFHAKPRVFSARLHGNYVRLSDLASRALRAFEQQTIQHFPRVNDDWIRHFERRALIVTRNQLHRMNQFFGIRIFQQEGIFLDRFVRQPAAARLFPCEVLIENRHVVPGASQLLAAHCTGRASADDCYLGHEFTSVFSLKQEIKCEPLRERENRQGETGAQYSTENRSSYGTMCLTTHYVHCQPLQQRDQNKIQH